MTEGLEGGSVPKEFDGTTAPSARDKEGMIKVAGGVQLSENVDEDLWG